LHNPARVWSQADGPPPSRPDRYDIRRSWQGAVHSDGGAADILDTLHADGAWEIPD